MIKDILATIIFIIMAILTYCCCKVASTMAEDEELYREWQRRHNKVAKKRKK